MKYLMLRTPLPPSLPQALFYFIWGNLLTSWSLYFSATMTQTRVAGALKAVGRTAHGRTAHGRPPGSTPLFISALHSCPAVCLEYTARSMPSLP